MNKLSRNATGLLLVLASLLAWANAANAQIQTFSKWTSITPDPRQFAEQRGGVLPLVALAGDTPYFEAGQYMIYVAPSNPNGMKVSRWNSFGPFTLQGHDKWKVTLLPGSQLRMENNPAPLQSYASPGPTYAMIYVRNEDVTSWHSICVLPVGTGKNVQPDCFGGTTNVVYDPSGAESAPPAAVPTYSKWTSITPDPRQFATQPGGALPLIVLDGDTPHFDAGQYMIYVAPSNPNGMKVSRWNRFGPFTLQGNDKWKATLLPQSQLRMERNPAPLQPYAGPGPTHAMIYVRNDDLASWHSICVLPVGTGKNVQPDCFGGTRQCRVRAQRTGVDTADGRRGLFGRRRARQLGREPSKGRFHRPEAQDGQDQGSLRVGRIRGCLDHSQVHRRGPEAQGRGRGPGSGRGQLKAVKAPPAPLVASPAAGRRHEQLRQATYRRPPTSPRLRRGGGAGTGESGLNGAGLCGQNGRLSSWLRSERHAVDNSSRLPSRRGWRPKRKRAPFWRRCVGTGRSRPSTLRTRAPSTTGRTFPRSL
jgi:hypothetical protein